jgi:hypothetical protein
MNKPPRISDPYAGGGPNKNYTPAFFSSLYVKADRYYFDLIHDSSRNQDLATIKTIYGALLAKVEHNLRKTTGLSLTKEDVLGMDELKVCSFRNRYLFFEHYASDEVREYLSFIVELRGLNTHFAHWETPKVTPTIQKVLDTFHSEGTSVNEGHITFFGMALIISPMATSLMMHDAAFALVNKRESFGPEGDKMRPYSGKLAPMLINKVCPPYENASCPDTILNPLQYHYLCSQFFKDAGVFFLDTEAELADAIKARYLGKEDYMKHLNGNIVELMDEANYLPGDENRYLRNDIHFLRNAVFHGNLFEEDVDYFHETKPLTLDDFCDVFERWADALVDTDQRERHLSRARRCLAAIPHNVFARPIEISYKIRFKKLLETGKVAERVAHANKVFESVREDMWQGFNASMEKVMSFYVEDPCPIELSPGCFKGGDLPYTYEAKGKLIVDSYSSTTGIWVDGVNANANTLMLARIPETDLPLTAITDRDGHSFHESEVTREGVLEIHHQVI